VLATRHLQERVSSQEGALTGEPPMRAIDKDGVIWHWNDELGWRVPGDPQEEASQSAVMHAPKRSASEASLSAESRRRIYGLAPSPSRARAAFGFYAADVVAAIPSAARTVAVSPADPEPHRAPRTPAHTVPQQTLEWSCPDEAFAPSAAAPSRPACNSTRRELIFSQLALSQQQFVHDRGSSGKDVAGVEAVAAAHMVCAPPTRPLAIDQGLASNIVRLSSRESAATTARLYESGGRKGFTALKERTSAQKVHSTVAALVEATRLKPCDTALISRTIGRADHVMLRAVCALFLREVGESLGAALLRLGDSDAKTVLCGVIEGVELWCDELPADEGLAEEQADFLHASAVDEATLSAAAVHVFATASDEQVISLKAAYRVRYRKTIDSLIARKLVGPIHYQLRDLLLARCGVIRHRPAAAAALTELMAGLVDPDTVDGAVNGFAEQFAPASDDASEVDSSRVCGDVLEASETMDVVMTRAGAPTSLRGCAPSTPSLMLLQQPDGKSRRLPGGYAGDVPSGNLAPAEAQRLLPQLRGRTPQYAPDRVAPARPRVCARSVNEPLCSERGSIIAGSSPSWQTLAAHKANSRCGEDDGAAVSRMRRERWAAEEELMRADMAAVHAPASVGPGRAAHLSAPPSASKCVAAAVRIQASARRMLAVHEHWRLWQAILCVQAAARGWAVRRALGERPTKLGTPLAHPMTRLIVPASRYFQLAGGAAKPSTRLRSASPRRAAASRSSSSLRSTTASAAQRHVRAAGSTMRAASSEAVGALLQAEFGRARQKQVQSILSFDR
jgi:hypothetical protein